MNDTLVVVLGDHGQIFPEEKAGEWGHGLQVYEPSLRIPVLLFIPGGEGGAHDSRLFQPVDISSTIIEYLGLSVPWNWVGRNMLEATDPGREFIVAFNLLMPLLQQDWMPCSNCGSTQWRREQESKCALGQRSPRWRNQ